MVKPMYAINEAIQLTPSTLGGLTISRVEDRLVGINILIYGDSGVGKTVLAGSASDVPEMCPVLVIDIEGGTESLKSTYPDVDVVRVQTWDEMQSVYNELALGKTGYKTVILDSLTEIQKFNMYFIMDRASKKNPNQDPDVPSMREWGINLEQCRRLVRAFRDLPMNTIVTALSKDDKNERTAKVTTKPSLSGKLAGEVAAFLDIVGYYYVKAVVQSDKSVVLERNLLTQMTDQYIAKDRSGKLPQVVSSPTMRAIYDLMNQPITQTTNETGAK